ncbi:hypothetical protein FACS1894109_11110 [Spirochaetia bacterium]|nr:hypothetical protein FACS1894109_11110 [Spirochaetia bacterium]
MELTRGNMDIFDYMDCVGCDSYQHIREKIAAEPDKCYEAEDLCTEDSPDSGLCERMRSVIEERIYEGELEVPGGKLYDHTFLEGCPVEEIGAFNEDYKPSWWGKETVDFSSAPYWFVSDDPEKVPVAYKDEWEVFQEYFA